jgi:hypothetical protein
MPSPLSGAGGRGDPPLPFFAKHGANGTRAGAWSGTSALAATASATMRRRTIVVELGELMR